ncbi:PrsW family glutamic-type intramembrane protease [Laceyella tengchongensis]
MPQNDSLIEWRTIHKRFIDIITLIFFFHNSVLSFNIVIVKDCIALGGAMLKNLQQWIAQLAELPSKYPMLKAVYKIWIWLSLFMMIFTFIFIEEARPIFVQFLWSYYVLWQFFILARSKTFQWKTYTRFFLVGAWVISPLTILFITGLNMLTGASNDDLWSEAVATPIVEEVFKLLPLLFFLLLFKRSLSISLTDYALIGAATGAGFQFVEEAMRRLLHGDDYGYSSGLFGLFGGGQYLHWDFFSLFPGYFAEEFSSERMTTSHAVATALVALTIGLGIRLKQKLGSYSLVIPVIGFLWVFLDHAAWNSDGEFDDWVYTVHEAIGSGFQTKSVFLLLLIGAIVYDYVQLNRIRRHLPLLQKEVIIEPIMEFIVLFFSLIGERKRFWYSLVFYRDRRELGFRLLVEQDKQDYTEIEKLKIRTNAVKKQLAAFLLILFILCVPLVSTAYSFAKVGSEPTCIACVFEDIGDWWDGLSTFEQLMIMGSVFALSTLFTGGWSALALALTAGDLLGMAGEFGAFLRNPRAWLQGLSRLGGQEALAYAVGAGLERIPEVKIGKKMVNAIEDYVYRLVRDPNTGAILRGQSSVLATRLKQAGEAKPRSWYAAHHIVPGNESENPAAVMARQIFDQFMLDPNRNYSHLDDPINSAVNGVWLPQRRGIGNEAYHPKIHTDQYYNELLRRLQRVQTQEDLIQVLQRIKRELQQNNFPL